MSEVKNVPKLRFPQFTEAWEQRKLRDVVNVCSGRDYKHLSEGTIPVYGTGGYMLSVSEALSYDEDAIGIGRKGTIDNPYILKAPFWTVDTLFYAIPRDNVALNFAFDLFQRIDWKKKDESTGVPSLSKAAINDIDVLTPKYDEQQVIGAYFENLDHLITLHQRKYDSMLEYKKGLLQKMFPKAGETVPEIRFPGFDGAWEEKSIQELGLVQTGNTPSTSHEEYYDHNGMLWITPTDIKSHITTNSERKLSKLGVTKARIAEANSILVTCIASIGKNTFITTDSGFNQQINALTPNKDNDPYFLFTQSSFWSKQLLGVAGAGGMKIANKTDFSNLLTIVPSLEEQQKIGSFFKSLDEEIELQKQKVELIKEYKKGLLQQMFV